MDKIKVCYVTRKKRPNSVSIERVFDCIENHLREDIEIVTLEMPEYRVTPIKLLKNILYCRKRAKEIHADIYHITGDIHYIALALPPEKTILTIHDLYLLRTSNIFKRMFFNVLWFKAPLKWVDKITAISRKTALDLEKRFPTYKDKIQVIENPLPDGFTFHPTKTKDPFRFLQIGTRENKNLLRVAEALKGLNCELRIIGQLYEFQNACLQKNQINYSNVFNISDEQMIMEYENCDAVVFVSTFEGFGMPIIEGQAIGRPVITSNLDPMKEIGGENAELVDPFSVKDIRKALLRIMTDKEHYEYLVKTGLENIKRFDKIHIANKYLKLYSDLLNE